MDDDSEWSITEDSLSSDDDEWSVTEDSLSSDDEQNTLIVATTQRHQHCGCTSALTSQKRARYTEIPDASMATKRRASVWLESGQSRSTSMVYGNVRHLSQDGTAKVVQYACFHSWTVSALSCRCHRIIGHGASTAPDHHFVHEKVRKLTRCMPRISLHVALPSCMYNLDVTRHRNRQESCQRVQSCALRSLACALGRVLSTSAWMRC